MRYILFAFLFIFTISHVAYCLDDDLEKFAEEQKDQLDQDYIDVQKMLDRPWYIRHRGKLIGAAVGVGVAGVSIATMGTATAPAAAAGAGIVAAGAAAGSFFDDLDIPSETSAPSGSLAAGALMYLDGKTGRITIPDNKRQDLKNFYNENYRSWVARSSTKEEFGKLACREILAFLAK